MVLEVRGLEVGYGERRVLRGIDLAVGGGELVALVGPNGCGKTTLLKAITRVVPWGGGDVLIGGTSAAGMAARDLARRVAVVPQNPLLPAGYSAAEVVLMGRTPQLGFFDQEGAEDYARAAEALKRTGAGHLAARPVDELSGGERQGVLLARALAQDTPLLLLDEPTANLDIGHQILFAGLIRELATSGLAVLAAIHDLTLASFYCDRMILMAEGVVVATGAPADVLTPANLRRAYGVEPVLMRAPGLTGPAVLPYAR